ncbi:MAG: segregation/condensation protein A [Acidobacteriota bacterium]|nr:segregation/condensation protein A [Acidobacteriota bacterium]
MSEDPHVQDPEQPVTDWPDGRPEAAEEAAPGAKRSDSYRIQLATFDGPLDLLLHLIRVNEINIYDIPIAEVTRQYEEYLDLMHELNLELAGEYLVMAATLVYIKSKMMLPTPPGEEQPQEDPRAELRDRLLEYQRYKEAALILAKRHREAQQTWAVGAPAAEMTQGETVVEASLLDLLTAFQKVLRSIGEEDRMEFRRDTLPVADSIARIWELLEWVPSLLFEELILQRRTRAECVVMFLAVLEMIHLQMLRATQASSAGQILIWRRTPLLLTPSTRARRAPRAHRPRHRTSEAMP